ncbi:DUF2190 family protein [Nostoc linckia]|uniref:DUF2190 family protein n=1 Tax=Nostoc linckia TaxID=92942 RepID=UPI000BFFC4DC|nr:DUF2190 family protein [Nostoc linckia]
MKNYKHHGDTVTVTAGGTIASGAVVVAGGFIGIANISAVLNDVLPISIRGVFELTKLTTDVVAIGDKLYWDAGNSRVTLSSAGNRFIGIATTAAGNTATVVSVLLSPGLAGNSEKLTVTANLADVSAPSTAYAVSPIAGKITRIYSVLGGAITTADSTVLAKINGTNITGGSLTITAAGSAAGDVDIATPTALNTVAAGDVITFVSDGASSTTAPITFVALIEAVA